MPRQLSDFQVWISRKTTLHHGEASNGARLAKRLLWWLEEQERDRSKINLDDQRERNGRRGKTD